MSSEILDVCLTSTTSTLILIQPSCNRRSIASEFVSNGTLIVVHSIDSLHKWKITLQPKQITSIVVDRDIAYNKDSITVATSNTVSHIHLPNFSNFIIDMAHLYDKSIFKCLSVAKTIMFAYHKDICSDSKFAVHNFIPKIDCNVTRYRVEIGGPVPKLSPHEQTWEVCTSKPRIDALIKAMTKIDFTIHTKVMIYAGDTTISNIIKIKVPDIFVSKVDVCKSVYDKSYGYSVIIIYNPYVVCNRGLINKLDSTKNNNAIIEFFDQDREIKKYSTSRVSIYKELGFSLCLKSIN